jgi:hypothetical protein
LLQLEHQRGRVETQIDRLTNPQQFVGMLGLDQMQKATQALPVDVDVSLHGSPRRRGSIAALEQFQSH